MFVHTDFRPGGHSGWRLARPAAAGRDTRPLARQVIRLSRAKRAGLGVRERAVGEGQKLTRGWAGVWESDCYAVDPSDSDEIAFNHVHHPVVADAKAVILARMNLPDRGEA